MHNFDDDDNISNFNSKIPKSIPSIDDDNSPTYNNFHQFVDDVKIKDYANDFMKFIKSYSKKNLRDSITSMMRET
ncbi:hypothetical protein SNEBB_000359, partial [Seison nebaliae]